MNGLATETAIRDWRYGQTQAERLVAAILHLEGFEDIDPQHPLGGPDGLKDVLCRREKLLWVAAAFFPSTSQRFSEITDKFVHDFAGVNSNHAQGFVFMVNQPLTVSERQQLIQLTNGARTELYHLERIRSILDSPKGCGIRLEYLRIPMTEEEQWSFWSSMNQDVVRRLLDHEARYDAQIRALGEKLDLILARTTAIEFDLHSQPSHLSQLNPPFYNLEMPTASITITTLCWLHRVITEESHLPEAVRGRLRSIKVWIGPVGSTLDTATFIPPAPEEIIDLLNKWINWWTGLHEKLHGKPKEEIVAALAEFHHRFLLIHPFLDGNGRLARILLDQAARELLNQSIGAEFIEDISAYLSALRDADKGDNTPLQERILAALE